jgi:hypothetical protein
MPTSVGALTSVGVPAMAVVPPLLGLQLRLGVSQEQSFRFVGVKVVLGQVATKTSVLVVGDSDSAQSLLSATMHRSLTHWVPCPGGKASGISEISLLILGRGVASKVAIQIDTSARDRPGVGVQRRLYSEAGPKRMRGCFE